MIQLKNIDRSYKTGAGRTWVLRRVNLEIREGEFITVMGPSARKILAAQRAGAARRPVGGRVLVSRAGGSRHETQAAQRTGQETISAWSSRAITCSTTSPFRKTSICRSLIKTFLATERQSLVADTLDRFQIVAKKDLYPNQLSGGQQQLVGIARAVIHKPPLLLADEPTGNLHSGQAKEIMELFRGLNQQGTTIVQVTHSEANAAYGSRTIQMRDGWLVGDTANPIAQSIGGGQRIVNVLWDQIFKTGNRTHLCLSGCWLLQC